MLTVCTIFVFWSPFMSEERMHRNRGMRHCGRALSSGTVHRSISGHLQISSDVDNLRSSSSCQAIVVCHCSSIGSSWSSPVVAAALHDIAGFVSLLGVCIGEGGQLVSLSQTLFVEEDSRSSRRGQRCVSMRDLLWRGTLQIG